MFDSNTMAELLDAFVAESSEGLSLSEQMLLRLERSPEDGEALAAVFRAMHTIKGNAGIFDFAAVAQIAHAMEDLLERLRSGKLTVAPAVITLLLEGVDALGTAIHDSLDSPRNLTEAERGLTNRLRSVRRGRKSEQPAPTPNPPATHRAYEGRKSLRVEIAKLDRLLDLSGEIGIARGRVTQMISDPLADRAFVLEADRDALQLHLELQELVMKLRMVPVGPMFRQMHRTVRDLARGLQKEAELRIEGEDVEVDMAVIDHLKDPLTHMIRNSLDHGIEAPDLRAAAGKRRTGTVRLRSFHDAGTIVIDVEDDGAGIDRDKVLDRARTQGLVRSDEPLTDEGILDLLFMPGFSTAKEVTDVSGRGVGLDVVRRNIEAIRGTVTIAGAKGEGTRIRVRLPLTLAMIEGLRVSVGTESYIIPMEAVVEALGVRSGTSDGTTGLVRWREEDIPFIRLRDRLGFRKTFADREHVVVVRSGEDSRAALIVDALFGECQTVVKPLTRILQGVAAISGSAILPNGKIAFIIDVPALLAAEAARTRRDMSFAGEMQCSRG